MKNYLLPNINTGDIFVLIHDKMKNKNTIQAACFKVANTFQWFIFCEENVTMKLVEIRRDHAFQSSCSNNLSKATSRKQNTEKKLIFHPDSDKFHLDILISIPSFWTIWVSIKKIVSKEVKWKCCDNLNFPFACAC